MAPSLLLASAIAAACFFGWPLRMNQSGLSALAATFMYAGVSITVALAAMMLRPGAWSELRGVRLAVGLEAGVINVAGVLAFTYMLAHATRIDAPRYILIVITLQTALTGMWNVHQSGGFDLRTTAGLVTAMATVLLLR
jgi:hypothetical protein